jgi:hypothetical protein
VKLSLASFLFLYFVPELRAQELSAQQLKHQAATHKISSCYYFFCSAKQLAIQIQLHPIVNPHNLET